jgi:signal transduction histidine kinase
VTRRLYLRIYLGFLAILLVTSLAMMLWGWHDGRGGGDRLPRYVGGVLQLLGDRLPPPGSPASELQAALATHAERLDIHITVWSPELRALAWAGDPLRAPSRAQGDFVWLRGRFGRPGVAYRLQDGRWLGVGLPHGEHGIGWLGGLLLIAGAIALGAYPISRAIVRRIERLRAGVDRLGEGDLTARVAVEGRDEVADLATSFNAAAGRIERLVGAERRMLASASHELRSPLARLRVAVELMGEDAPEDLRREAETNVEELDELIEDLLLSASLESRERAIATDDVDLYALAEVEAARVGARLKGGPTHVLGDERLLRRMLRNLLENARRHAGSEIDVEVAPLDAEGGALLRVLDRGPGVAEAERERVFEPFYRPAGHSEGAHGGVGLGLALVREIARHHDGDAVCLPRAGGGTAFEVEILGTL